MELSLVRFAIVVCLISAADSLLNLGPLLQNILGHKPFQGDQRCGCRLRKPKDPIPSKKCSFKVTDTNQCVGVTNGSSVSGTQLAIYPCNGAREWLVPNDGTIREFGKCMDVRNGGKDNETPVQLLDCNGSPDQQWVFLKSGQIKNPQSKRCLDVKYAWIQDGQPMIIYDCKDTNFGNQAFVIDCK